MNLARRWRRIRLELRLYREGILGNSFACNDSFRGIAHPEHQWVTYIGTRSLRCRGLTEKEAL